MKAKVVFTMILLAGVGWACRPAAPVSAVSESPDWTGHEQEEIAETGMFTPEIGHVVRIVTFFRTVDSIAAAVQPLVSYPVTEHLLLRANPWLVERLAQTDYYLLMAQDSFVYDQRQLPVLQPDDLLLIPSEAWGRQLQERIAASWIDVNIPEYTLRLMEGDREVYAALVRVGQNRMGYFADAGRNVDLRTKTGEGIISAINYDPIFSNPRTGVRYESTRRDDGRRTLLPRIPSLEPEINSVCTGQLIHCTTNPETLGRAYSNGCIGVGESDMWRIYAWAPVGTRMVVRYDLEVSGDSGEWIQLPDIYGLVPKS